MPYPLSVATINIDGGRTFDRVLPFLNRLSPDVLCVQEVYEVDLPRFDPFFATHRYVPMTRLAKDGQMESIGFALFCKTTVSLLSSEVFHYVGNKGPPVDLVPEPMEARRETEKRALLLASIEKQDVLYVVGTTHFSWVPKGEADDYQRRDVRLLMDKVLEKEDIVLCGDFNAPRGREIFDYIAVRLRDNVPPEFDTSLDPDLHPAKVRVMVDGIFSTRGYRVDNVRLTFGISDHAALSCEVVHVPPFL